MTVFPASVAALLVSCTLLLALRPFAQVVGLIDKPGGRKTHHGEVPVIGGIAMFAGLVVAAIGGEELGRAGSTLLVGSAFMVVVGALDDRFDLPPRVRLFAHVSAAVALVYGTQYAVTDLGDLIGLGPIRLGWLSVPFTVVAIVALINAFNMLDGLDGLAGSSGLVAFAGVMLTSAGLGHPTVTLIAGSMTGAVIAFLLFNLPLQFNRPVRTFMGDAGSTLLGFVLAGAALVLVHPGRARLEPVLVLWLMPIPIFELFASTIRRIVRGMSPTEADTGHFHHRLVAAGFSVRAICLLYFVVSSVSCTVGVLASSNGLLSEPTMFVGFCLMFCAWLTIVYNAPRLARLLPKSLQRIDPAVGH